MSKAKEQNEKRPEDQGADSTRSFGSSTPCPGSHIGPFCIERELGRGAAGVVYLAHDTKLDRSVAIKSLPAELMENTKALTRFAREARVLASLNHPNIAAIYEELQEAEGVSYLVLEYVPGQTLAERISGKKLKPREALAIARQIAEAVAAAHEHEIIHRDLKPRNIKITPGGKVKVLDFGLAKTLGGEVVDQQNTVTEPGRIIGTPAYMSPEQARGLETDKRSDIWSFGCLLYEMLTGKVPFKGETVPDTLAGIVDRDPDWHTLPQATPANIQVLLRRCLEKDPNQRLHDIADAAIEINETLSGVLEAFVLQGKVAPICRLFQRNPIVVALGCVIGVLLIAGAVFMSLAGPNPPEPPVVSRLLIPVPEDKQIYTGTAPNNFLTISPDGTRLVYVGQLDNRNTELYIRSLDGLQIRPIPGTRNAHNPFFSPDGQWVGFFMEEQLKKVSLMGGEPLTLLEDVPLGIAGFGSWAEDGTIVFSVPGGNRGLQRIPDNGGRAENLTAPAPGEDEVYYCYPQVLPGGNAILYSHVYSHVSRASRIEAFLPKSRERQVVLDNASYGTYVRSGYLIFVRGKGLIAAPFDVRQLKITGPLTVLVDDKVAFDWGGRTPQVAFSRSGTVVYVLQSEFRKNELVWVDRRGLPEPLAAHADVYESPCLSPDGRLIAVTIQSQKEFTSQVRVYNVENGKLTHLTTQGENRYPQWSPDGTRIAFWSGKNDEAGVFCRVVDAGDPAELLACEPYPTAFLFPYSWSNNGNLLACTVLDPNTKDDIWIVDLDGDKEPRCFLNTECREYNPTFSPDGRWLAYVSEESGQPEIYLREYVEGGRRVTVSTDGGINPAWSRDPDGRELYYMCGNSMMVVKVTWTPDFDVGAPEVLFKSPDVIVPGSNLAKNYDVSDDGRFLMIRRSDKTKDQLVVVQNWFEELKRLAAPRENR